MLPLRKLQKLWSALRSEAANPTAVLRGQPKRKLALERLEDRSVLASGYVGWATFAAPADSLDPAQPTTSDAISFTLYETHYAVDVCGAEYFHGGMPHLSFDLANKVIDIVFIPEGIFCGGDIEPIQGLEGAIFGLDAGDWTLNGPHSSIQFTVTGEPVPHLSISDVTVQEGDAGSVAAEFTLSLSVASDQPISVNFATADGFAKASDGDYVPQSGTLTFAPGETLKSVNVQVSGDLRDELDETFALNLGGQPGVSMPDTQGVAYIQDNDPLPAVAIADASLAEGNAGASNLAFTVTLSAISGKTVIVYYTTADGTATYASGDYQRRSGVVGFNPGETTGTILVPVNGDLVQESDESFAVNLSIPNSATLADPQAIGTIRNDDVRSLSIGDVAITEGNSGTKTFTFTVSLTNPSSQPVTVNYATANGSAKTSSDYKAKSGSLVFAPGQTMKTIQIVVNGDKTMEDNETFFVNLSSASGAAILDGQGIGTILNDDRSLAPWSSAAVDQAMADEAWLLSWLWGNESVRKR